MNHTDMTVPIILLYYCILSIFNTREGVFFFIFARSMMSASRVLVYGGRGALGSAVVDFFKSKSWVRKQGGGHINYIAVLYRAAGLRGHTILIIIMLDT